MTIDPVLLNLMQSDRDDEREHENLRDQISELRNDVQYGDSHTVGSLAQDALSIMQKAYGTLDVSRIQNTKESKGFYGEVIDIVKSLKEGSLDFHDARGKLRELKNQR